jgi:hypothetical protein
LKRLLAFAGLLFVATCAHGTVTNVQTRPAGASGSVQFNNAGVFGSSPTFTYDKTTGDLSVSTVSVTYIDGSTATLRLIYWGDGTIQTTAAGSGSYILLTNTLQSGATLYVSSASIAGQLSVQTIKFPNGSIQTTAPAGGGAGSFWVGTATSALNMGGLYAVINATDVVTSTLTVTGATETHKNTVYIFPSSTTFSSGDKLMVYGLANGSVTMTPQNVILDGMRKSSTDTVTAEKYFQKMVRLPLKSQAGALTTNGDVVVDTSAYTVTGSSGTLSFYSNGTTYYVIATTSTDIPVSRFPVFNRTANRWEISPSSSTGSSGGGGSGTPGGSTTEFQYNNAGAFAGISVATFNATTGLVTFSSAQSHVNISSVTYNNANIVMGTGAKIYYVDGTIQVSSPPVSSVVAGYGLTGGGVGSPTLTLVNNSTSYIHNRPISSGVQSGTTAYPENLYASKVGLATTTVGTETIASVTEESSVLHKVNLHGTGLSPSMDLFQFWGTSSGLPTYARKGSLGFSTSQSASSMILNDSAGTTQHTFNFTTGEYTAGNTGSVTGNSLNVAGNVGVSEAEVIGSTVITKQVSGYQLYRMDSSSGNVSVTLEALTLGGPSIPFGRTHRICKSDSSTHTVTINGETPLSYVNQCVDYFARFNSGGVTGSWYPTGILTSSATPVGGGGTGDITDVTVTAPLTGGGSSGGVTIDVDRSSFTLLGPDLTDSEIPDTITVGASGSVNNSALSSGVTFDTEWDTTAEIEAATGVDLITSTEAASFTAGTFPDARISSTITRDAEWDTVGEIETATGVDLMTSSEAVTIKSTQTVSGGKTYTSPSGIAATYGVVGGSVTANDLTGDAVVYADSNKKLTSVTIGSGLSFAAGTLSASGGSAASLPSTQTFSGGNTFSSPSGVSVTYGLVAGSVTAPGVTVSTLGFSSSGYVQYWTTKTWATSDINVPTTSTQALPGFTATLPAGGTYYFHAELEIAYTGTGGYRAAIDVPTGGLIRVIGWGDNSSLTALRMGERLDTDLTPNSNAFGAFNTNNHQLFLSGYVVMGNTAGPVSLCVVNGSLSNTSMVVKQISYMSMENVP